MARVTVYPNDIHFEGFPESGAFWWIRWVEFELPQGSTTESPMLRLTVGEIPGVSVKEDLPDLQTVLAADRVLSRSTTDESIKERRFKLVRVHAGWLPLFGIGLVLRRGQIEGVLSMALQHVVLGRSHKARIGRRRRPKPAEAPMGRPDGEKTLPGTDALGDWRYPLPESVAGRILSVFEDRAGNFGDHVVIPCLEVLRTLYAPHRRLALAILGGPWDATVRRVLNPGDSGLIDGAWRLALRPELPAWVAAVAGNLWLGSTGRKSANRVWASIVGSNGQAAAIEAALPFDWQVVEFEVAGIRVITGSPGNERPTFLGLRIASFRWPDPPEGPPAEIRGVRARRERDAETEDEPVAGLVEGRRFAGGTGYAEQDEDPDNGEGVDVLVDGVDWGNAPEVTIVGVETPVSGPRYARSSKPTGSLSAGAGYSAGEALKAQVGAEGEGAWTVDCRWTNVVATLKSLKASGWITDFSVVTPPSGLSRMRGDFRAWAIPRLARTAGPDGSRLERWYALSERNARLGRLEVRRTALVLSVAMPGGLAYWLELERRGDHEAFRSLGFRAAPHVRLEAVVGKVLEFAANHGGAWGEADRFKSLYDAQRGESVVRSTTWRHLADGDPRYPGVVASGLASLFDRV